MLHGQTITMAEGLIISALGLTVVFLALVSLSIAIMISGKIIGAIEGKAKPAATKAMPAAAPVVNDEADKEMLAVLASVIAEDLDVSPDEFRITSVTEMR